MKNIRARIFPTPRLKVSSSILGLIQNCVKHLVHSLFIFDYTRILGRTRHQFMQFMSDATKAASRSLSTYTILMTSLAAAFLPNMEGIISDDSLVLLKVLREILYWVQETIVWSVNLSRRKNIESTALTSTSTIFHTTTTSWKSTLTRQNYTNHTKHKNQPKHTNQANRAKILSWIKTDKFAKWHEWQK